MNYSFETAFCNNDTRNFLFLVEDTIIGFLNDSEGLFTYFSAWKIKLKEQFSFYELNPYERMLVHSMAECFNLTSLSTNSQPNGKSHMSSGKHKKFEPRSQDSSKNRDITLIKTPESRVPVLTLHDYFTEAQNMSHKKLYPNEKKTEDSPEIVIVFENYKRKN